MEKILVTVNVPTIEKKYDIFLPINLPMKEVVLSLQKSIFDLSDGYYIIKDDVLLFDFIDGSLINQNNIVKFSGLRNGSSILMI